MVAEHNVSVKDQNGRIVADMDYSMFPAGYGVEHSVAAVNRDRVDEDKPYYTISGILVKNELRRRGLATAMLEAARSETDFPIYHSMHLSDDGWQFAAAVQSPAQVLDEDLGDVRDRVSPSQALFERVTSKISEEKRLAQEEIKSRIKSNNDLKSSVRELDLSGQFANKEFPKVRTVTETGEYVTKDGKKIILSRHDQWDIDNEGREYLSRGSVEAYLPADGPYDTGAGPFIEPTEVDPWPIGSFYYSEAKSYYIVDDNSREKLRWDETEVGGSSENMSIDNTKPFTTVDWVEVERDLQREGIATAMMEFARTNAGMPIYHDITRTPSGTGFSEAVQSSQAVLEEDLGEANPFGELIFDDTTPALSSQEKIRRRVKSDDNLTVETDERGRKVDETGEYTTADGERFKLVREDWWDARNGDRLAEGIVEAFAYNPNGTLDDGEAVAVIRYSEVPSETFPNGIKRWFENRLGGTSKDADVDAFKPFSTIDNIYVAKDVQRRGIGTAILEFARGNAGMPIYHSYNLTDDGEKFAGRVQSSQTPTDEDLGSPTPKKKIEIPPLAPESAIEPGRDPDALKEAAEVRKKAEQMEPEVTNIMVELAETLGGDLDQLDQRLKSTDSLARKIKADADKDHDGDIKESAANVSDSIRYTMTVDGSRYTDSVSDVIAKFKAMGYEVKVKNFWEGGDPYQGINMKLKKNGVTVEFQMHTPESLQTKVEQLHDIYETYREIDTDSGKDLEKLDRKSLLWEQMIGIASTIPNPDKYDELLNIGTLVQQQFEL
jgi:GNAT superfamily N-acetyltransferase